MSGVNGAFGNAVIGTVTVFAMAPIVMSGRMPTLGIASSALLLLTSLVSAAGTFSMATLAANASGDDRPRLMAFAFVVNACVPVIWHFAANVQQLKNINRTDVVGFIAAIIAAYCLSRPR